MGHQSSANGMSGLMSGETKTPNQHITLGATKPQILNWNGRLTIAARKAQTRQ
jgi:hypothetical protein